jgi:ribosomal protein L11 methyltransferase
VSTPDWKIELIVPTEAVAEMAAALEPFGLALSCFEIGTGDRWTIETYTVGMPNKSALVAAVAVAASAAGIKEPDLLCAPLPKTDWLAENRRSFPPIQVGRYFVYPTHYDGPLPANAKKICLDAATAFGSGEHETTRGCLATLGALARRIRPRRVLDLGCGSGILSIAAAKMWPCQVLAVDIDQESVRVCRANALANGVGAQVSVLESDGVSAGRVRRTGPFDMVLANVLAGPLIRMAPSIARQITRPGNIVLSGLLQNQQSSVTAAYLRRGFLPVAKRQFGDWPTLLLKNPV